MPEWKQILGTVCFCPHNWPLESVPQGSKRILSLGCGNRAKLFQFARRGYEVSGMDVEANTIRPCKELLIQRHFILGELQETGLPDAHFNSIRIDNVLEHVPDPKDIIRECHRLLRAKEQLLVYVPHDRSLSMRLIKSNSIFSWMLFHFQLSARKVLRAVAGRSRLYRYSSLWQLSRFVAPFEFYVLGTRTSL